MHVEQNFDIWVVMLLLEHRVPHWCTVVVKGLLVAEHGGRMSSSMLPVCCVMADMLLLTALLQLNSC